MFCSYGKSCYVTRFRFKKDKLSRSLPLERFMFEEGFSPRNHVIILILIKALDMTKNKPGLNNKQ